MMIARRGTMTAYNSTYCPYSDLIRSTDHERERHNNRYKLEMYHPVVIVTPVLIRVVTRITTSFIEENVTGRNMERAKVLPRGEPTEDGRCCFDTMKQKLMTEQEQKYHLSNERRKRRVQCTGFNYRRRRRCDEGSSYPNNVIANCLPLLLLLVNMILQNDFWLLSHGVHAGRVPADSSTSSSTDQNPKHPTIIENLWHKIQQATMKDHQTKRKNLVSAKEVISQASTAASHNQQLGKDTVLSTSQEDFIQKILSQATSATVTETTTEEEQKQQQQQLLLLQQQYTIQKHAIATKGQQRRQALYKYTTQQHYATLFLRNVMKYNHHTDAFFNTTESTSSSSSSSSSSWLSNEEMLAQQNEYNKTVWNMASEAFFTYTHTTANRNHQDYDNSIHNPQHSSVTNRVKIDRTSFLYDGLPPYPKSRQLLSKDLIRQMFQHGYDSYMYHAFPEYGEVCPLSCRPCTFSLVRIPALTLIDSLDTLLVFNNRTEFARSVERLRLLHTTSTTSSSLFAIDQNVSVFETNIRVLGGLLSAHQLALALHLDQPEQQTLSNNKEDGIILLSDIFDNDSTNIGTDFAPKVRFGSIDHTLDPVDRWWQNERKRLAEKEELEQDVNSSDESPEVCKESFDSSSMIDAITSPAVSVSPCDSASVLLQNCPTVLTSTKFPLQLSEAATCPTKNSTATTTTITTTSFATKIPVSDVWTYDGFLLELALDIGSRLLPAFTTPTGIPYGTVNLLYGVPNGETPIASLAGGGTLSIEFELLSRLTGDTRFGRAAKLASRALFRYRSHLDLFGKHIDIRTGTWAETLSGIGSNSDSFLEYLAKHYMLFPEDDDFWIMFKAAYAGVYNESRLGEWYADVDMNHGTSSGQSRRVFESLAAFYPGLQVQLGEIAPAARTLNSMSLQLWRLEFRS
jgi:Glycosyl hydrolase family 47